MSNRVNDQELADLARDNTNDPNNINQGINDKNNLPVQPPQKQDTSKKPIKASKKKKVTPLFPIIDITNDCVLKRTGKQLIKGKRYSLRWDDIKELKSKDYKYVNTI